MTFLGLSLQKLNSLSLVVAIALGAFIFCINMKAFNYPVEVAFGLAGAFTAGSLLAGVGVKWQNGVKPLLLLLFLPAISGLVCLGFAFIIKSGIPSSF